MNPGQEDSLSFLDHQSLWWPIAASHQTAKKCGDQEKMAWTHSIGSHVSNWMNPGQEGFYHFGLQSLWWKNRSQSQTAKKCGDQEKMVCVKVSGHIPLAVIKISGWTLGRRILHHLGPSVTLVDQTQSVKDTKQFYVGQHSQIFLQMNLHVTASANWIRKQGGALFQGIFLLKQKVVRIKGMWQRGIPTVWWKGEMPPAMRTAVTPPRTHLTKKKKKKKKPKGKKKEKNCGAFFHQTFHKSRACRPFLPPRVSLKMKIKHFRKPKKVAAAGPK